MWVAVRATCKHIQQDAREGGDVHLGAFVRRPLVRKAAVGDVESRGGEMFCNGRSRYAVPLCCAVPDAIREGCGYGRPRTPATRSPGRPEVGSPKSDALCFSMEGEILHRKKSASVLWGRVQQAIKLGRSLGDAVWSSSATSTNAVRYPFSTKSSHKSVHAAVEPRAGPRRWP